MKAPQANLGVFDDATHTLYASDKSGSVAVTRRRRAMHSTRPVVRRSLQGSMSTASIRVPQSLMRSRTRSTSLMAPRETASPWRTLRPATPR